MISMKSMEKGWHVGAIQTLVMGMSLKYLAEHPELIGMYRGGAISRDDVIQRIWQANGWKCETVGQLIPDITIRPEAFDKVRRKRFIFLSKGSGE